MQPPHAGTVLLSSLSSKHINHDEPRMLKPRAGEALRVFFDIFYFTFVQVNLIEITIS